MTVPGNGAESLFCYPNSGNKDGFPMGLETAGTASNQWRVKCPIIAGNLAVVQC